MQYSQEHLKTMVYAEFGGQTECIMGNSKIENTTFSRLKSAAPLWRRLVIYTLKGNKLWKSQKTLTKNPESFENFAINFC